MPSQIGLVLGIVLFFSVFVNLLVLTSPIYMMQIYDRVLVSGQIETLIFLSLIALGGFVAMAVFDSVRGYVLVRLGRYLDLTLREPVLESAIGYSRRGGAAHRKLVDDLSTARNYIGSQAVLPFIDAPWVPFFVAVIWIIHPWLGMLALGSALLLFGVALLNDHLSRKLMLSVARQQYAAGEFASAAIQQADVVHAMGMKGAVYARFRGLVDEMGLANQQVGDIAALVSAISKSLRYLVQSAALGLGAYLVISAQMTPGGMIAGSIILGRALAPIEQSIGSWRQFVGAREAYIRLRDFLSSVPARNEPMRLPAIKGSLRVEELLYMMPEADAPVLKRVSFGLEPGTALAVVGPSASGKSTLCRLLVGALAPTSGHVRVDGADIVSLHSADAQAAIGYLPQNIELFAGTVRDNIARFGGRDDNAVVAAARAAGCHDMILRLQKGYDTEIGVGGMFLSGGQRQRVALARALYGAPRYLVLDEPNSNLDQEGEIALVKAIDQAKQEGATVIVVSHRSTLMQPIDKLAVLRDGILEKFGDRDEVLRELAPKPAQPKPTLVAKANVGAQGGGAAQ
ncbi:hypothetical protein VE26_08090 [Devosia chinhatensis]|uniref:Type I secretion system permease/ATPase n=1 Tax=Devosia chinhatensis TaxID=429727 RepID=A0A0F5FP48_9HYPH|nr:hypothetical protein VE26_08090 [Devosia chinhatensis]